MIIFNDDMSQAPRTLRQFIGRTARGDVYIWHYDSALGYRMASGVTKNWCRDNQPVKWAAITEAQPMIAVSEVVDKLDEAGAQYFDRGAGAMVAASGLFGGAK